MNKDKNKLNKRAEFVYQTCKDPIATAKNFRSIANGIEYCKTPADVIFALSEILFLSENTIYKDLRKFRSNN